MENWLPSLGLDWFIFPAPVDPVFDPVTPDVMALKTAPANNVLDLSLSLPILISMLRSPVMIQIGQKYNKLVSDSGLRNSIHIIQYSFTCLLLLGFGMIR